MKFLVYDAFEFQRITVMKFVFTVIVKVLCTIILKFLSTLILKFLCTIILCARQINFKSNVRQDTCFQCSMGHYIYRQFTVIHNTLTFYYNI